jgi:uncharacterized protein YaaW (UPF0174 family)
MNFLKKINRKKAIKYSVFTLVMMAVYVGAAYASGTSVSSGTAPDGLAGDVYTILVQKILMGPIGFTISVALIAYGVIISVKGELIPAILALVAGGVLFKVDSIADTLAFVIM